MNITYVPPDLETESYEVVSRKIFNSFAQLAMNPDDWADSI